MIDACISLHVNYNLDEDITEEELNEIIRDMYQDASGEISIGGKRYEVLDGKIKNFSQP